MAEPFGGGDQLQRGPDDTVYVVDPHSKARGAIKLSELDQYLEHGYQLETPEASQDARLEQEYGDVSAQGAGEAFLRGTSFGTSDVLLGGLDPEGVRERRERSPIFSTAFEVGGAIATGGMGAGGALTKGAEAAAGAVTAGRAAGMGTRLLGATTKGVVEGAGYGVGAGVSEVALSPEPMTWEGAASTIGSNALGGALVGGALGGGLGLLGEGARAAKAVANKQVEALTAGEKAVERGAYPEMASYDQATTAAKVVEAEGAAKARKAADIEANHTAQKAEVERLKVDQSQRAEALYGSAEAYQTEALKSENFIPTTDKRMRGHIRSANSKITKGLDNKDGFIGKLGEGKFRTGLQEQATFFERTIKRAEDINPEAEQQAFLDALPKEGVLPKVERPFHEQVLDAAKRIPEGEKFGDQSYISDVWKHAETKMTLPEFKEALLAEQHAGRLRLARGDMPALMSAEKLAASEVIHPTTGKTAEFVLPGEGVSAEVAPLPQRMAYLSPEQSAAYARWEGFQLPKGQKAIAIPEPELMAFRRAVEMGDVLPESVRRVETAERLLKQNRALQEEFKAVQAEPASQHLEELRTKLDQVKGDATPDPYLQALKAHAADLQKKSLGYTLMVGAGGILGGKLGAAAGPVGAMGGAYLGRDLFAKLYERFVRKVVSSNATRQKSIKTAIATMFESGASKASKTLPRATAILATTRYASADHVEGVLGPARMVTSKDASVEAFRERAREINALTERGPNGVFKVRQQALEAVHDRMAGVWAMADAVANGIEKTHQARLEFLASKLPRDPTPPHLQAGPSNWEPTKPQMAEFARIMEVAERPEKAIERLSDGTATPNDVETLKAVYPSHYEDVRQQCFDKMAVLQHRLPYTQRLNLSILLDVPVDPALTPEAMSVYQMPPPPPEAPPTPSQNKPLPTGMVAPTAAQHASSS